MKPEKTEVIPFTRRWETKDVIDISSARSYPLLFIRKLIEITDNNVTYWIGNTARHNFYKFQVNFSSENEFSGKFSQNFPFWSEFLSPKMATVHQRVCLPLLRPP